MSQREQGQDGGYPLGGYGSTTYKEPHRATLILVLGLVGFFFACGMTCPFAWWMGRADLQKMEAGTMDSSGQSMTRAGHILGIIGTVLVVVPALLGLLITALYFLALLALGVAGIALSS
jgi:hypothetical protein